MKKCDQVYLARWYRDTGDAGVNAAVLYLLQEVGDCFGPDELGEPAVAAGNLLPEVAAGDDENMQRGDAKRWR